MNGTVLKVAKIAVSVLGVGVSFISNYFAEKDLDAKVTKKVAEALANAAEKES